MLSPALNGLHLPFDFGLLLHGLHRDGFHRHRVVRVLVRDRVTVENVAMPGIEGTGNRLLAVSDERSRRLIAGVVWQMCKTWQMSEWYMMNDFRNRLDDVINATSDESNSRLVAGIVTEQIEQLKHNYQWRDTMLRAVEITGFSHNTIRKGMNELKAFMKLEPSELFAHDRVGLRQEGGGRKPAKGAGKWVEQPYWDDDD